MRAVQPTVAREFKITDPVGILTIFLVLLVGIPATLVVGPLGGVGSPATLLGVGCLLWWLLARLDRRFGLTSDRQPLHLIAGIFMAAMFCGYAAGMMRVIQPLELRSADRAVLRLFSGLGIMLLAADGISSRAAFDRLLRSISIAGGILAAVGVVQFVFGIEVTSLISVPGLESHAPAQLIQQRSNFRRVSGTTSHPIEFGVTLSMLLPVALHCAFTAARRRLHWLSVALMASAIPASISRSAMLGLLVAWVVLFLGWDSRRRLNALIATPIALVLMRMAVPGLLGTLKSLFTGLSKDPSFIGRTDDYAYVDRFIAHARWFGRGLGTFIPEIYTTLDNQYLGQIVETGYIGLCATLLLLGSGVVLGWQIKRHSVDAYQHSLGVTLSAAAIVPFVTFVTFDGFSFPVAFSFTFLILGSAGAARRLYPRIGRELAPPPVRVAGRAGSVR